MVSITIQVSSSDIFIQTQYAIYRLIGPACSYLRLFLPWYTKDRLLCLVLRAIRDDPYIEKRELLGYLSSIEDLILGRCWTEADFNDNVSVHLMNL